MHATHTRAGIFTLLLDTGKLGGTLLVDRALRLALNVRVALQSGQAGTTGSLVPFVANCIGSTGGRTAWIYDLWSGSCC